MPTDDDLVEVKDPDGSGWIAARFVEVDEPVHVDHPGAGGGEKYEADQYRVMYLQGHRQGTTGLHTIDEIRRAG
jgi:hypothetical protein